MKEIILGEVKQFAQFPAEILVDNKPYFLMKEDDSYTLMSRRCPHAGDTVELEDGELVCPMHGWTFEVHTGRCHNVPSARLACLDVSMKDGNLVVVMP
ncbi:Rieske (2Fe-2S) protein [Paenibacillus aestuarii]|uniref:Rieske (2Fe-2S) protein n=1 Tax=Paenibacillus aestuarii TaxID=516965 RepID=A0ABW0K5X0_9BACL|nr:Rieske (2Fe-2S) protein [Paenibacillus aestuarii]